VAPSSSKQYCMFVGDLANAPAKQTLTLVDSHWRIIHTLALYGRPGTPQQTRLYRVYSPSAGSEPPAQARQLGTSSQNVHLCEAFTFPSKGVAPLTCGKHSIRHQKPQTVFPPSKGAHFQAASQRCTLPSRLQRCRQLLHPQNVSQARPRKAQFHLTFKRCSISSHLKMARYISCPRKAQLLLTLKWCSTTSSSMVQASYHQGS